MIGGTVRVLGAVDRKGRENVNQYTPEAPEGRTRDDLYGKNL